MRILLAAKHAPHGSRPIGGVQSWCRTVYAELSKRGHVVVTWGPEQSIPRKHFDLGLLSNLSDTHHVEKLCERRIVISHGIIPAENPVFTGDPIVFTSEGVRDHWGVNGTVIRQPIDTDFWSPKRAGKTYLTRFSYRRGLPFVKSIARKMGLSYIHVMNEIAESVRITLRNSACVLATGRAALESMACGAPTVLCDHRAAYQGPLLDTDIMGAHRMNYSGRGGVTPTEENVHQAIRNAIEAGSLRGYVVERHNVSKIVDQLLGLL